MSDDGFNYTLILAIINESEDPAETLKTLVAQEREDAAHKAMIAVRDLVAEATP